MDLKSLFRELKRRNIYKVGVVYAITAWVIVQVASIASNTFGAPAWVMKMIITVVVLGFPVALVIAWAFEITPDGIQRSAEVNSDDSIARQTGRRLNYWIIGLLAGAVVLLLAERIWFAGSYTTGGPNPADSQPSVAVLPFVDISQANDQEWYSDGLTEELLNSLARTGKFHLASRTSSFAFKNSNLPIRAVADSLNVNHVVEGSVRRSGDDLRITAQLISADNDSHIWSNTFDVSTDSVFEVQRSIAENITSALNVYLDESERREMLNFGTRDVQAYELYLRAIKAYRESHRGPDSQGTHWRAAGLAAQALEYDSTFAGAYYLHHDAYVHFLMDNVQEPPDSSLETGEAMRQIRRDLSSARRYAETEAESTFYRLQEAIMSDDWSDLPGLVDRQFNNPKYLVRNVGFAEAFIVALDRDREFRKMLLSKARNVPLNQSKWLMIFRLAASGSDTTFIERRIQEMIDKFNNPRFARGERMHAHVRLGTFDRAMKVAKTQYITPFEKRWARFMVQSANGDTSASRAWVKELVSGLPEQVPDYISLQSYHIAGEYEIANRMAENIDAAPLGPLQLLTGITLSNMWLTFDSNATPNLEARLQELGVDIHSLPSYRERLQEMRNEGTGSAEES